jgi:O-antigen/teichoic acid export membrane protein
MRVLMRLAPTFLSTAIFATLYWRIDVLMLSKLASVEDLGYYGAAYRVFELAAVLPQSLCLAIYPQIVAAIRSDHGALRTLGGDSLRLLLAATLPAATLLTVLPHQVLQLLYGSKFHAAAGTLSILIWTVVPYSFVRYQAYLLVAANRQGIDLLLNVLMSVVNIALNLILIPRYSFFGAACATLASICILSLLQSTYVHRYLPGHAAPFSLPPILLGATAVAGGCAWLLAGFGALIAGTFASVVYLVVLVLGGFFSPSELRFLHLDGLLTPRSTVRKRAQ